MTDTPSTTLPHSAQAVLDYWFGHHEIRAATAEAKARWFAGTDVIDETIRQAFDETWQQAAAGELSHWQVTPLGELALIIVLDQFSRNIHRGNAAAFAQDHHALRLSQAAIASNQHIELSAEQRVFMAMPMMHAEDLRAQQHLIDLLNQWIHEYQEHDDTDTVDYLQRTLGFAETHRDLIAEFGRFPYRNAVLGRDNTPSERSYLDNDPVRFGQ